MAEPSKLDRLPTADRVVADSLRFKRKLSIGEDAYTSVRIGKMVYGLWDLGGVAMMGAWLAGRYFATGGIMAALGITAAAAPLSLVIGSGVASAGAYYGISRLIRSYAGARVETIPKFINSPIDALGMALLDLIAELCFKIAKMDGQITEQERELMRDWFIDEWGYDRSYVEQAFPIIEAGVDAASLKQMMASFVKFTKENPDCNFVEINSDLMAFLEELAQADGHLDERETLAIEAARALALRAAAMTTGLSETATAVPKGALGLVQQVFRRKAKPL